MFLHLLNKFYLKKREYILRTAYLMLIVFSMVVFSMECFIIQWWCTSVHLCFCLPTIWFTKQYLAKFCFYLQTLHWVMNMTAAIFHSCTQTCPSSLELWNEFLYIHESRYHCISNAVLILLIPYLTVNLWHVSKKEDASVYFLLLYYSNWIEGIYNK